MATLQDIFGYFTSGQGRLIAAGILFALIFALERVPWIKTWLNKDSGKWLSSARKKLAANVLLAMGPTALMLTDPNASANDILLTTITAITSAAGVNSIVDAAKKKPTSVKDTA
jgi:hypothetical protein